MTSPLPALPTKAGSGRKVADVLARRIAADIVERGLRPHDRLASESELLEEFGVGRASLREALRILESHGVVALRRGPQGGAVVGESNAANFARVTALHLQMRRATWGDLLETLLQLEPFLARLAAERWTSLDELDAVTTLTRTHPDASSDAVLESFQQFHEIVERIGSNAVMGLYAAGLRELNRVQHAHWDPLHAHLVTREGRERNVREHLAIARAIAARNGARSERLMRAHLQGLLAGAGRPRDLDDPITWG